MTINDFDEYTPPTVDKKALSRIFQVTEKTIDNWVIRKKLSPPDKSVHPHKFNLPQSVAEFAQIKVAESQPQINAGNVTLELEKSKLQESQLKVERQKIENAILKGEYVKVEDVGQIMDQYVARIKSAIVSIPNNATPQIVQITACNDIGKINAELTKQTNDALTSLSNMTEKVAAEFAPIIDDEDLAQDE